MQVVKRDGRKVPVDWNKVNQRNMNMAYPDRIVNSIKDSQSQVNEITRGLRPLSGLSDEDVQTISQKTMNQIQILCRNMRQGVRIGIY